MKDYLIRYCELCDKVTAMCKTCNNWSCTGLGCEKCFGDKEKIQKELKKYKKSDFNLAPPPKSKNS